MHEENVRRIVTNLQNNPNFFEEPRQPTSPSSTPASQTVANGGQDSYYASAPHQPAHEQASANGVDEDEEDFEFVSDTHQTISNRERRRLAARRAGERVADNIVSSVMVDVWTTVESQEMLAESESHGRLGNSARYNVSTTDRIFDEPEDQLRQTAVLEHQQLPAGQLRRTTLVVDSLED